LLTSIARVLVCSRCTIASSTFGVSGLTVASESASAAKPWRSYSHFRGSCKQASSVVHSRESWTPCSCPFAQLSYPLQK
jgi:hypothetical protein